MAASVLFESKTLESSEHMFTSQNIDIAEILKLFQKQARGENTLKATYHVE